jgi:aminomethyltransferase
MVEFAGWQMPVQYSSIVDEHVAVRERVGLFDVSHMGEVEIRGAGAQAFCRRVFANDVARLGPGRAQYNLIPNENGGIVDDVIVYRLADERFLVCLNASNTAKDLAWLRERNTPGCELVDRSADLGLIAVQGPNAAKLLAESAPELVGLARFGCCERPVAGVEALVARTGYTGEDGFELFVDAERTERLWTVLLRAGEALGARAIGLGARDTLRLEAALPLYGHELAEDISPFEAGLDWVVKLDRPDMVGYAALRSAAERPARRLIGLAVEQGIAREGCSVLASGVRIGVVTSGTHAPTLGRAVAMALVERDAPLEALSVEVRGRPRPARVTALPFYVRHATESAAS